MRFRGYQIDQITPFKHPLLFTELLLRVLWDYLLSIKNFILRNLIIVTLLTVSLILVVKLDSLSTVHDILYFASYWIILGVASSIGLGTGLHTFVLYLGPHIAKVAIIASSCGYLPEMVPSRWDFDHFAKCTEDSTKEQISFFGILLAVQLESILWGLGTAIGELPPYFAAYKASKTRYELQKLQEKSKKEKDDEKQSLVGEKQVDSVRNITEEQLQNEEIAEVEELKRKSNPTLIERAKIVIFENIENYGFITILLCASIPNPLFDLAGITCGHLRIPFRKFFLPTFIGKAIIKVHIQMLFVITIFRKEALETVLGLLSVISENLSKLLKEGFEKQKKVLFDPSNFESGTKPLISRVWDTFLMVMIGYFLYSIISGLVQEKAIELRDKQGE